MTGRRFCLMTMVVAVLALLGIAPLSAQQKHIAATLVAESSTPKPGSTATLAFRMVPEPGWHGYWKNPGDAGTETQATWTLPTGVTATPLAYPVPTTLLVGGLMNYVYEGEHALLAHLKIPAGAAAGSKIPVRVKLDYLVCTKEVCVPESGDFATELTVGDGTPDVARTADFARWRAAIPQPLGAAAAFAVEGGKFRLGVPLPAAVGADQAYFFPLTHGPIDYAAPQAVAREGDRLVVETALVEGASPFDRIEGVLRLSDGRGVMLTATPGTVARIAPSSGLDLILLAVGGAILGGLLLNIMPCVFPILSLKALGLARSGGDERSARREAIAYAVGAVATCAALGGLLLALRAGGSAAGWAFQLQNPWVMAGLLVLVLAIALNLAGLFELPGFAGGDALARQEGASGAFWTGALAAFVATPCTGPFMGAALGAALVLPPAAAMAVFVGLGFGLALPFLAIGFIPALRRRLPKPGPWMDRFRCLMSIPMFLTALALAWVLGKLAGVDGMALGLSAALLLGIGLWATGRRQADGKGAVWMPTIAALGAVALVGVVAARPAEPDFATVPFSEAKLAELTGAGKPVFVYFTADWCVTCKVNEKAAIERREVTDAFARKGITVMVGDWTRGDADITRFLAGQNRSGVPLYLFYGRGSATPQVLPQVLTPGVLTALGAES